MHKREIYRIFGILSEVHALRNLGIICEQIALSPTERKILGIWRYNFIQK